MAKKDLNIAVVGLGYWGPNLLRVFYNLKGVKVAKIFDKSRKNLNKYSKQYNIPGVSDYKKILKDGSIDAVVIATPMETHYELAKNALMAGKSVFVEKPMTLSYKEAVELNLLAKKHKKILMVGHLLEYHPALIKAKEYIDQGKAGKVFYIYSTRVNLGKIRRTENALWSLAPHDISAVLFLLKKHRPIEVSAYGADYLQKGIEDVVFVNIKFSNNVMVSIHVSWLDPHKIRKITIIGSEQMIVFDDMEPKNKIKIFKGKNRVKFSNYADFLRLQYGTVTVPSIKMEEPLIKECSHFIHCLKTGKTPISDGKDGMQVTGILEAAQKSLKSGGRKVKLP